MYCCQASRSASDVKVTGVTANRVTFEEFEVDGEAGKEERGGGRDKKQRKGKKLGWRKVGDV